MEQHFCSYCSVMVASETELRAHCNSESHQLTIMSDEGRDWKYRAPARGVGSDQYALCIAFANTGKCRLGKQCCDAHGDEELVEWKERFDYRQMKLQRAKECSLQGRNYTEQLLEKWLTCTNPNLIMTESLDTVDIKVEPDLNLTVSDKNCCREWTFLINAKATLRHVALLYETHRNHFRISQLRSGRSSDIKEFNLGTSCQEWSNVENVDFNEDSYAVKVRFVTSVYGTFRQAVVFDFGFEPVLIKKLSVDVVSVTDMEKLQQARDTALSFTDRWNSNEVTVIPFENRPYAPGEQEQCLLTCYPPPNGNKFNVTQSVMEPVLTKTNYNSRQHELLCIEEMAQYELLSRFNVKAHLNVSSCYLLTPNSAVTAKYAHGGELFANMQLSSVLSEDSSEGRLILTNCSTVLLAPVNTKGEEKRKVYEAVIEDKGKTVIYIRLSKRCVEDLGLKADREFKAEVQFQLNRLPLCEMHFAIDRLYPPSIVFPDITALPRLISPNSNLDLDPKLNPKQKEAVMAIVTPLSVRLPPVLIIGPFGTGKTFTLAQAVKLILNYPESRILVCTHSNSAADIYIREYLHPQVAEGRTEATPLRIYYRHRWVATVHPTVKQYCLVNEGGDRNFNMPTVEDVKKHKVIVTTLSTSRYLVQLGLEKGFFTHILIDEAAQAMECEAIMPLSLANENTRIVLAGDHMQLSPEVYSQFAQQRNLHTSLLERLYDLYPEDFSCKVLLCENYRSHEAIIKYTSELFYDNHLRASGQQPRHEKYYPLTFFTALGEDIQDCNSTAFHNYAEVNEIVERVIELKKNWPSEWGDQDETSIGVVTPYYDQVVRIRAELRKKKLHGVSVERVLNVQGKQFRVIFLSAVRTRQTCNSKKSENDLDHGFLSNARLLNTAITRAQSLVAVVGDPVSLCSVGKCRKLWEKFILTCSNEDSLFGITWDSLRSQLDSMELKKNFILNPLAPEFVPGRMYHGQPSMPLSNEQEQVVENNAPPPPSWFLFPFAPLQGPPLIQPAMVPAPPIMPAPHPYNMMNSFGPIMLPGQNGSIQGFPFNPPALQPPPMPQRPANLSSRMPPAGFPRKINNTRSGLNGEFNGPSKEIEQGPQIARQINKRNEPQPQLQRPSRAMIMRMLEENVQKPHETAEEAKQRVFNRIDALMLLNKCEEHTLQNGHMHNMEDKIRQQLSTMKPHEIITMYADNGMQINENANPFTELMQHNKAGMNNAMKPQEVMRMNLENGMLRNEVNNVNLFPEQMQADKAQMNNSWLPFSSKSFNEGEIPNTSMNHSEDHGMRQSMYEVNRTPGDRDGLRTSLPQAGLFMDSHSVAFPTQVHTPPTVDKWTAVFEALQMISRVEIPQSIPAITCAMQEKLNLMDKILPPGMDLMMFIDSEEQTKAFLFHLMQTEGSTASRTFLMLLMAVKKDQDAIMNLKRMMAVQRYSSPSRTMPDVPSAMRNVNGSPFMNQRPMLNNSNHLAEGVMNNSESFGVDSAPNPFAMPRMYPEVNPEMNYFNNCEQNQEFPKPNFAGNQNQWIAGNNIGVNSNVLNRPVQEPPFHAMSKLSIHNPLDGRMMNGINGDIQDEIFLSDSFSNRRRLDMERMSDNMKRIWLPSEYKMQQHAAEQRGNTPFQLAEPGTQGSYLSRLRSVTSTVENGGENSQLFPFSVERLEERSPIRSRHEANLMTAGPLSMSYPDIPDILSSHILPNGNESSKVIRKPQRQENPPTSSPFMFDMSSIQANSESSLRYPQLSSEGMTYAKILRSPQQ